MEAKWAAAAAEGNRQQEAAKQAGSEAQQAQATCDGLRQELRGAVANGDSLRSALKVGGSPSPTQPACIMHLGPGQHVCISACGCGSISNNQSPAACTRLMDIHWIHAGLRIAARRQKTQKTNRAIAKAQLQRLGGWTKLFSLLCDESRSLHAGPSEQLSMQLGATSY